MAVTKLTIYNKTLSLCGSRRLSTVADDVEEQRLVTDVYDDCRDSMLMEHPWTFAQKRAELIDMTHPDVDLWETATSYAVGDTVFYNDVVYNCLIANTSVTFSVELAALDWEVKLTWVTATGYAKGDQVYSSGLNYTCLTAHTAGTFATDLTSVYWILSEVLNFTEDGMSYIFYRPTDLLEVNMFSNRLARIKVEELRILSNVDDLKIIYTYSLDTPSSYTSQFRDALAGKIASEICFSLTNSATKAEKLLQKFESVTLPKAVFSDSTQGSPREARADEWIVARQLGSSYIYGTSNDGVWHPY